MGALIRPVQTGDRAAGIASYTNLFSVVVLRLVKMVVAPLALTTLTDGIARLGSRSTVGAFIRMGRTLTCAVGNSIAITVAAKWEGALAPAGSIGSEHEPLNTWMPGRGVEPGCAVSWKALG